ncbi:hypothetical protein BH20ACI3_BH20ACI3_34490 [soil metagenome]
MNKSLEKIFDLYVGAFAFFFASKPLSDPDFWFHLKTGEYIFLTGLIPRTEFFSFTHYGSPWVAHGWLSGVIFYLVYSRPGFYTLIFIFAILATTAFWIAVRRSHSHHFLRGFAMFLGVWTALPTIGVRPRVFTLLLVSVFLTMLTNYARRGQGRSIWWLVPLMVLWVNLHGGFLIGLALIALTIIGIPLDALGGGEKMSVYWPRMRSLALLFLACLLAGLINPYGVRIYTFLLHVLSSPVFQEVVVDWVSPDFHRPNVMPLALLIMLTIASVALSPKRVRPSDLLLFLATLYATLKSQRNMAIFALVAAPLLAEYGQNFLVSTSFGKVFGRERLSVSSRGIVILCLLSLLPLAAFVVKLKSTVYATPTQALVKVPINAVEYLRVKGITGNTFTDPNLWGGYLIWALPSNPVYIDGRDVYPEQFVKEYSEIINGIRDWKSPFDRYGVRIVMTRPGSLLARELQDAPEWQMLYQDEMAVVFNKR